MHLDFAALLLAVAQAYVSLGLLLAIAFLLFGIERFDPAAKGSYAFRPLLVPGLTLLWPLVLARWAGVWRTGVPRPDRHGRRHAIAWIGLALVIPVILLIGMLERRLTLPPGASRQLSASEVRP